MSLITPNLLLAVVAVTIACSVPKGVESSRASADFSGTLQEGAPPSQPRPLDGESSSVPASSGDSVFSHELFDKALSRHVKKGLVDYAGFKTDEQLGKYISLLAEVDPDSISSKDEQLAFWINAYNAFTIHGVATLWPKISSVSTVYPKFGFFNRKQYVIGGEKYSLDQIENKIIRKRFDEPRIHTALNCASISCPLLANYAFSAEKLDSQLEERMRLFVNDPARNELSFDKGVVRLSEIFKWFKVDFDKHGGIKAFVGRYLSPEDQKRLKKAKVRYLKYNWSLNKV